MSSSIYDACVGRVDDDADPDDPPQALIPHDLMGNDTWLSSYKIMVVDNLPASATGAPGYPSFDIDPE